MKLLKHQINCNVSQLWYILTCAYLFSVRSFFPRLLSLQWRLLGARLRSEP